MKSVGIIAEYNPLHNGHIYQLEKSKEITDASIVVAAISGNFTQRGEPTILDKWTRAEIAVKSGINLVVEIPVVYCCNSAEYFAKGGVEILEAMGVLDYISFGAETGNVNQLIKISEFIKSGGETLKTKIEEHLKNGNSYPRARQQALEELMESQKLMKSVDLKIIESPNNILAIEYLKQIKTLKPIAIQRFGAGHLETQMDNCKNNSGVEIASASQVRQMIFNGNKISNFVPKVTELAINEIKININEENRLFIGAENYYKLLTAKVLEKTNEELQNIFGANEGLGNKIKNEIRYSGNLKDLMDGMKSKRYTYTRITRLMSQILLGITKDSVLNARNYIRILAFDAKGAALLKKIKNEKLFKLPIITNINKDLKDFPEIKATIEKDILATDIYNLILGKDLYNNSDYIKRPFVYFEKSNIN